MASLNERIRGLYFSADELSKLTNWPAVVIEDYLSILDSLLLISESVDSSGQLNIINVTTDYIATAQDGLILANANSNDVTIFLGIAVTEGEEHTIKCVDDTFTCLVNPQGNGIDGDSGTFQLWEDESITIKADSDNNWWIK